MRERIKENFIRRQKVGFCKENKGFTLVEMIVTMVVLSILLTVSVTGLLSWQDWSDFNRVNEYAETMFLAAQNQLSEYSANGSLPEFSERVSKADAGNNVIDLDEIYYAEDKTYTAEKLKENSVWTSKESGTLCYVCANKGDYALYTAGQATVSKTAPFVFELLSAYVYDQSLLNETICIEFSLEDGQVFGALFTDKAQGDYEAFEYNNENTRTRGLVNIAKRFDSYRKERMVGYYGVDTLSLALRNKKDKPTITNLALLNEETLNLAYKIGKYPNAVNQLTYEIGVFDKETDKQVLGVVLDTQKHKLKNFEHRETISCPVTRFVYDVDGNIVKTEDLGNMDILAYLDAKNRVRVVFDAVDIQATSYLYEDDLSKLDSADAIKSGGVLFAKTLSFHRFGLDVENIYCTVQGYGGLYKPTTKKQSNMSHAYFASQKHDTEVKNGIKKKVYDFEIANGRHLNNIRYLEDLSETKLKESNAGYKAVDLVAFQYALKNDIDWKAFVKDGNYYNSDISNLKNLDKEYLEKGYFASIDKLRINDVFDGKEYTISGLRISQVHNCLSGVYGYGENQSEETPIGLFNVNSGKIQNTKLDQIKVLSSSDKVGAFCGVNVCGELEDGSSVGVLDKLEVLNTKINSEEDSLIQGAEHVGGIVGYLQGIADEENTQLDEVRFEDLKNAAKVTGDKYVGGIVGEIRTPKSTPVNIVVYKCENSGAVLAANSTVDKNGNITNKQNINPTEAKYFGGITGYCANMYEDATGSKKQDMIRIVECTSTPYFSSGDLQELLDDSVDNAAAALSEKLNGVYVGGIVGYNYYSSIEMCSTKSDGNRQGYVFGYEYVGGIVGYNQGPASGIRGGDQKKRGVNEANVVGYLYVGGITGCNADLDEDDILKQAQAKNYTDKDGKAYTSAIAVLEDTDILVVPVNARKVDNKLENWNNKGIVFATGKYAGGIVGYNTGWIFNCNSSIDSTTKDAFFQSTYSCGDYAGGIAGYNNGIIGNTIRGKDAMGNFIPTGANESEENRKIKTICYISGRNYVGGIVGYNDENAIVEDYIVAGGNILGNDDSCFVGGYAGFNASVYLLQDEQNKPRYLESKPNLVTGNYFVGGSVGGNIINTNAQALDDDDDDNPPKPPVQSDKVYAELVINSVNHGEYNGNIYEAWATLTVHNNSDETITDWSVKVSGNYELIGSGNFRYNSENQQFTYAYDWNQTINPGESKEASIQFKALNESDYNAIKVEPVLYSVKQKNAGLQTAQQKTGAATPKMDVSVNLENSWEANGVVTGQYALQIKNLSDETITNWRAVIESPKNIVNISGGYGIQFTQSGNKILITPFNEWDYLYAGQSKYIQFQIQYANKDDVAEFINCGIKIFDDRKPDTPIYDNTGDKPDTPTIEGNLIATQFKTNNFLGQMKGKAYIGGFMGYNQFIDNTEADSVEELQAALIRTVHDNEDDLKKQYQVIEELDEAVLGIPYDLEASAVMLKVTGTKAGADTNTLGSISGDLCVGGVMGYNNKDTLLYMKDVVNATPVIAKKSIGNDEEQQDRTTDYAGKEMSYTYSYVGGIIGKVGSCTTLDGCKNANSGTVKTQGTYSGGLCEINEGVIMNCVVATFGSSLTDYVGGLCGLNKKSGYIQLCSMSGVTVSGRNIVGGFVAENFGNVMNCTSKNAKLIVSGLSTTDTEGNRVVDAVAGGYVGYNVGTVLSESDIENISIRSQGNYAGAVAAINDGLVLNAKVPDTVTQNQLLGQYEDYLIRITGSISARQDVGGVVGLNRSDDSGVIRCFENKADITALYGNAGGIVGNNAAASKMEYCVNRGAVTASNAGNAGGMTAVNNSEIHHCFDYVTVKAPVGMSGGIVAENKKGAKISYCTVAPEKAGETMNFSSQKYVGGIAAYNAGTIENINVRNLNLYDYKNSVESKIGVVAGYNDTDGRILLGSNEQDIRNCTAKTYTENSQVGGVAGYNAGTISGAALDKTTKLPVTIIDVSIGFMPNSAAVASFGGIAGLNDGTIEKLSVRGEIEGNLSTETTGYGGIAGVNGSVEDNSSTRATAVITDCSFDGSVTAQGAGASIARIGGVTGINGYKGEISHCYIGVLQDNTDINSRVTKIYAGKQEKTDANGNTSYTTDSYSRKYANSEYEAQVITKPYDTSSYAYIGGLAGINYGSVLSCDNYSKSKEAVRIYSFAAVLGGIVGYNMPGATVSGRKEEHLSTGKNWEVKARNAENDIGTGGIIGTNLSGNELSYLDNYADVTCLYNSNTIVGGLVGFVNQREKNSITISDSRNYGNVLGRFRASGFIALQAYEGIRFDRCTNYGFVRSVENYAGGFIQYAMHIANDIVFNDCKNHGNILTAQGESAGFIAKSTNISNDRSKVKFTNCVNTGLVYKLTQNRPDYNINGGGFVNDISNAVFENCRNYGNSNMFGLSRGTVSATNCLDVSGNTVASNQTKTLAPLANGYYDSLTRNNYYIQKTDKQPKVDPRTYGIYTDISVGNMFWNESGSDLIKSLYMSPDEYTSKCKFGQENNGNFTHITLTMAYEEGSQGADGIAIYPATFQSEKGYTVVYRYKLENQAGAILYDSGEIALDRKVGGEANMEQRKLVLPFGEHSGTTVKKVRIYLQFKKEDGSMNTARLFGFQTIPKAAPDTCADLVPMYEYIAKTTKTRVAFTRSSDIKLRGYMDKDKVSTDWAVTVVPESYAVYLSDFVENADETQDNIRMLLDREQTFTFDFAYEEDAKKIGALYLYLTTYNGLGSGDTYDVNYYVEFVDKDGNKQLLGSKDAMLTATATYHKELKFAVPDDFDASKIIVHMNSKRPDRKFMLCGFKWSEKGNETRMILPYDEMLDPYYPYKNDAYQYQPAVALVKAESTENGLFYSPFANNKVYTDVGISMEQNPQSDSYYNDRSAYDPNYDIDNSGVQWASNSRVGIYKELDPKFEQFILMQTYRSDEKLSNPQNLVLRVQSGMYQFLWTQNPNAYCYETYYELRNSETNALVYSTRDNPQTVYNGSQDDSKVYCTYDPDTLSALYSEHGGEGTFTLTAYVRAVSAYQILNPDSADREQYNSDFVSKTINGLTKLPMPEFHVEMIEGNKGVVVLDNVEEFEGLSNKDVKITVSMDGNYLGNKASIELNPEIGYSEPFTLTNALIRDNKKVNAIAQPRNSESQKRYIQSERFMNSGCYMSSNQYENEYVLKITNGGLYGKQTDAMEHQIDIDAYYVDCMTVADLVSFDETLKVPVAYSRGSLHTAAHQGGHVYFGMRLSDLPDDIIGRDFETRCYIVSTQGDIQILGHDVAKAVTLTGPDDLKNIVDTHYFTSAGVLTQQAIVDAQGSLRPGYVLYRNEDGTYDIYYSASLADDEINGSNAKYQVHRFTYQYNAATEDTSAYYDIKDVGLNQETVQYLQPSPDIEDNYELGVDEAGHETYTFTYDVDELGNPLTGDDYANAVYRLRLFGTTVAGEEVALELANNVKTHTYTFTDKNDNWNYRTLKLEVVREGTTESDSSMKAVKLPSVSVKDDFVRKIRLSTLSTPEVNLHQTQTGFDKDGLVYDVTWGAIQDSYETRDLGGYLIMVAVDASQSQPGTIATKPHYFYMTDIVNTEVEDTIGITESDYADGVLVNVDTSETCKFESADANGNCKAQIDLSDFASGEVVDISIKAVARANAQIFMDGYFCEKTQRTIPERLSTPDVKKLQTNLPSEQLLTVSQWNERGIELQYLAQSDEDRAGTYNLAIAIYDEEGKKLQELDSVAAPESMECVQKNGDGAVEGAWNYGAKLTLLTKGQKTMMQGASLNSGTYMIKQTSSFKLSDYAGCWMKIVLRAEADDAISSYWTDEDPSGLTQNYAWIQIPKMRLDEIGLTSRTQNPITSVKQFYIGNNQWSAEVDTTTYGFVAENRVINLYPNPYADGYKIQITSQDARYTELKLIPNEQQDAFEVYGFTSNMTAMNEIVQDGLYKKYGTLDASTPVETGYGAMIDAHSVQSVEEFAQGYFNAKLLYEDGVVRLILPDVIAFGADVDHMQNQKAMCTKTLTMQAMIEEAKQNSYVDSEVGAYCVDRDGEEIIQTVEIADLVDVVESTVACTPGEDDHYTVAITDTKRLLCRVVVVDESDVENKQIVGTIYGGLYGNNQSGYSASIRLNKAYLDDSKYGVYLQEAQVEDQKAVDSWSSAYIITNEGLSTVAGQEIQDLLK